MPPKIFRLTCHPFYKEDGEFVSVVTSDCSMQFPELVTDLTTVHWNLTIQQMRTLPSLVQSASDHIRIYQIPKECFDNSLYKIRFGEHCETVELDLYDIQKFKIYQALDSATEMKPERIHAIVNAKIEMIEERVQ